ncbi:MAG TPA: phospho-N-acetylmuramoyl-pentapeptide-transferase [Rhabdochlamydiaceae bacterium]|nr:phospho-N-acetylmuramoyl-pentapeptide-transferase [Rhabdochlamydiaceae bacterium]
MLLLFLQYLSETLHFKIPAAFSYSSTRMLFAAITTLCATILLGPLFIRKLYELKTGRSIRVEDCPGLAKLHEKKKDTPTMGGIFMLCSMILALLLWMDLTSPFTLILLLTTLYLGFVGGVDDYLKMKYQNSKGLSTKKKFLLQVLFASIIGLYLLWPAFTNSIKIKGWFAPPYAKEYVAKPEQSKTQALSTQEYMARFYLPFIKDPLFTLRGALIILAWLIIIFVITGSSNAVNLTDGLDGLAAGSLVLTSAVLAVFAFLSNNSSISRYLNILYIEGSGEIAVYLCALIGACLGFLWYNGHPAQIFMGDTGSLALGGIIGVSSILLRREAILALAGGIFVLEALSVIIQVGSYKLREKKRVFLCAPLHHHFEYKGWPETKVVLRFWIIGLILALIALTSIKIQ